MKTALNEEKRLRILANSTLYPNALLANEVSGDFPWHEYADRPESSQVFCMSAFGTLRHLPARDRVLHAFLTATFPVIQTDSKRPRQWDIRLEAEDPDILGEQGTSQATSIDVLLTSSREAVCVESKFLTDAVTGLGRCGQFDTSKGKTPACQGFYGPSSDAKTKTAAWCRLETWEGKRSPRLYWTLGKQFFKPSVFVPQKKGDRCPFSNGNYQLMRNFLSAAMWAQRLGKRFFGVIVICPDRTSKKVRGEVQSFKDAILLPEVADHLQFVPYETYTAHLGDAGGEASNLADFLTRCIKGVGKE